MAAPETFKILPLLKKLSTAPETVTPDEIGTVITQIFHGQITPVQIAAFLTALHYTRLDTRTDIIVAAALSMRSVGLKIEGLTSSPCPAVDAGRYAGGLVDIVGTGGDGHDTFNVSTTAAVLAAGCGLRICKHGNKASTSASGSADLLTALGASLMSVTPKVVSSLFESSASRFCFLYAPVFHPAMSQVAPIRRELGCHTIFNSLGPLVNPVDFSAGKGLEARIIGVAKEELGSIFAECLRLLCVNRGMVVCGREDLDEISIEGETICWRLVPDHRGGVKVQKFQVHPGRTFGVLCHSLRDVAGGKSADENAGTFRRLLKGESLRENDVAIRDFVVVNAAALLVVARAVDGEEEIGEDGVMTGSIWRNAAKKCRSVLESGESWKDWEGFARVSCEAAERERAASTKREQVKG